MSTPDRCACCRRRPCRLGAILPLCEACAKGGCRLADGWQSNQCPDNPNPQPEPKMLGDQDYPIPPGAEDMSASQREMKRAVLMDDLRQALEVLPTVVEEITQYTDESLEMYAARITFATCILHNIERRLNEGYERAQRGEDDEESSDDVWETQDGPSEHDKSMAIAALAAEVNGTDIYDEAEAAEYEELADGID